MPQFTAMDPVKNYAALEALRALYRHLIATVGHADLARLGEHPPTVAQDAGRAFVARHTSALQERVELDPKKREELTKALDGDTIPERVA